MIIRHSNSRDSELSWDAPNGQFNAESISGVTITLGMKGNPRLGLAHELGHLLHMKYISKPRFTCKADIRGNLYQRDRIQFRKELMAWRIARAIIKPKLWDETIAKEWLQTYNGVLKLDLKRIKIIPYGNKLTRLQRLARAKDKNLNLFKEVI